MSGPRGPHKAGPRFGLSHLTDAQRKLYDMLVSCYKADVAVEIGTKTRLALTESPPLAVASRTTARNLVAHGLADYSPAGKYLLLSDLGKRESGIIKSPSAMASAVLA